MATIREASCRDGDRDLLRFLTCGSVDDGKSTLIGRLLHDCALIFDDQLEALERESRRFGTTGGNIDFSLLLDGLEDERQQRITIDVAYRFFATPARSFVVADTPGHEQYTRNMATGASTCDLAVILVDARNGIVAQTQRHAFICSLLGIRQLVLAVNKMDLVCFDERKFCAIAAGFAKFAARLGDATVCAIPLSALAGDNVTRPSDRMPWYQGPTLLEHLETVEIVRDGGQCGFRFPVQWVNRPNAEFRGFSGTVVSGSIAPGDAVLVAGSGRSTRVREIVTFDGLLDRAEAGDAVTLTTGRRNRCRARRSLSGSARSARIRRSIRGARNLDERAPDGPGPLISVEDRYAHRAGHGHRAQISHRCRYPRPSRR